MGLKVMSIEELCVSLQSILAYSAFLHDILKKRRYAHRLEYTKP